MGASSKTSGTEQAARSFETTLTEAVKHVNEVQLQSDDMIKGLASGQHVDLHGTMIAMEKADISAPQWLAFGTKCSKRMNKS